MHCRKRFAQLLAQLAICTVSIHCVRAADAPDASVNAATLDTVIVTARKRDESLAEVPVSVTVFNAQTLEAYDIQSFDDYATKTPNMSFAYGGGAVGVSDARSIAIRGITGQNYYGTGGAT